MNTLKFARNYNHKLDNPIFTTIRSVWDDPSRYIGDHYVGYEVECLVDGEKYCEAKCIDADNTNRLYELDSHFLRADTGIVDVDEIFELFESFGVEPSDRVVVLTLKRTDQ